ncbi:MAG: MBOAT family protein [Candidatus Eisenbacteria bacterium]
MLFDTPVYIVFLVLVVLAYWRLPPRRQNAFLLLASVVFYAWWDYRFLALLLGSALVGFACGLLIDRSKHPRRRHAFVAAGLLVSLVTLGAFKYFNFFVDSLQSAMAPLGFARFPRVVLQTVLPPGISFYTFQQVAYLVEVHRKTIRPSRSIVDYSLFLSLFPHLIAGPIQRPGHLLPQVEGPRTCNHDQMVDGVMLIVTGLFRKCVIANGSAMIANAAFGGQLGPPSLPLLLLGAYSFALQIYGDFSGYSDIARGSAKLMGFEFVLNFRQPYLATTVQDFWRRWHISLSTWLRDYLFLPLSYWLSRSMQKERWFGIKRDLWIYGVASIGTMLIGGLWHGASWTFLVWGGFWGVCLALERGFWSLLGPAGRRNPMRWVHPGLRSWRTWGMRLMVFHLACLAWVLFRVDSLAQAGRLLSGALAVDWRADYGPSAIYLLVLSLPMGLLDLTMESRGWEYPVADRGILAKMACAVILIGAIALCSAGNVSAFIYFQF